MLCQNCNEKEATVQLTKIVNGEKTELHLCEDCAAKKRSTCIRLTLPSF
jgi:protein arginine kinase activator